MPAANAPSPPPSSTLNESAPALDSAKKGKKVKQTYRKFDPVKDVLQYHFSYNVAETKVLRGTLKDNGEIDQTDLRRVALWKLNRVLDVSDKTLEKLRELAVARSLTINDPLVRDVMDSLTASEGVGYPMASTFMKFTRPDVCPIIDVRAYRALVGKKLYPSMYTFEIYLAYAQALTQISKNIGRPLEEIDEQLYCFDKLTNGTI